MQLKLQAAKFFATVGMVVLVIGSARAEDVNGRVSFIIGRLASKNPAPSDDVLPQSYDRAAQADVYLAIQQLLHEGSPALDALAQHLSDKQYCCTRELPSEYRNTTVGRTCAAIMNRVLFCYKQRIHIFVTSQASQALPPDTKTLADYWAKNRLLPLWQIQVNLVDRQIEIMKQSQFKTAGLIATRGHHQDRTEQWFEQLKQENIKSLTAMRAALTETQIPYFPSTIDEPYNAMIGLPWETSPSK